MVTAPTASIAPPGTDARGVPRQRPSSGGRLPSPEGGPRSILVEPVPVDPTRLRAAYGSFPSGVTAMCALVDGRPVGMAASSFTSVSLAPPLVSVCVRDSSATWRVLRGRSRLGISVLAEDQDLACRALAAKRGDRFAGVEWGATAAGAVFVRGATVWFDCAVYAEVPAGDHAIVLLEVHALAADPDAAPLVFHGSRFHRLSPLV